VAEIVEAVRLIEVRGGECGAEAAQDARLVERSAGDGVGEDELVVAGLAGRLVEPL
jgi:hypothetical protein